MFVLLSIDSGDEVINEVIKSGARFFHYAYFRGKSGQQPERCRDIVEKHLIREAVRLKLPVLNDHFTTVKTHELIFEGSAPARGVYDTRNVIEDI
jgi:hypothetical protein